MFDFNNVTIVKKANVYFDGKVTSRTILFSDNTRKTLGIMMPGDYEFSTADKEIMEIIDGQLDVLLPGESQWKSFTSGQTFEVPSQSKFSLKVKTITDYCCSYIE